MYDPASSFFALPETSEEPITVDAERDDVELEQLRTILEVFKKRGWKHIEQELQDNIEAATNSLLSSATTMDEISRCRETIAAFNLLLNMPNRIRQRADLLASQLSHE